MTKKDYVAIADAFVQAAADKTRRPESRDWVIARYIADALARDNARFDRGRFLAACGVQE